MLLRACYSRGTSWIRVGFRAQIAGSASRSLLVLLDVGLIQGYDHQKLPVSI